MREINNFIYFLGCFMHTPMPLNTLNNIKIYTLLV